MNRYRSTWMLLLLGGVVSFPAAHGQESQNPPPSVPAPRVVPPPQVPGRKLVESVEAHRGGAHVAVVGGAERLDLDFSTLDFDADPLLMIDGKPVTQEDLRRGLCLLAATNEIEQWVTYLLGRRIQAQLKEQGYDPSKLEVSEEEVKKKFEEQKAFTAQMTGMDPEKWEQEIKNTFGWDRYVEFQKIQIGFEKLFLPEAPADFMQAQNARFLEMKKEWDVQQAEYTRLVEEEKRKAQQESRDPQFPPAPPPPVPEADLWFLPKLTLELLDPDFAQVVKDTYARGQELHPMIRTGVTQTIKESLLKKSALRFAPALPEEERPGVLFKLDQEVVKIDDVYVLIQRRLNAGVRELALREILALRAADKALARDGWLPTDEQAAERFAKMEAIYAGSLIPLPHAVLLRGFQNLHHYREYYRRKAAFQAMTEAKTGEEELRQHFDQAGRLFFEQGSVDGKILFLPAEDRPAAEAAMAQALGRVQGGEPFEKVLAEVGRFPPSQDCRNGMFTGMVRNRLRQLFQESEYTAFVTGYSLADDLFYRSREGDVVGPMYRAYSPQLTGSMAVLVDRYYSTGSRRTFEESRNNVLEDLADLRFPRYAMESLMTCEISIPQGRP